MINGASSDADQTVLPTQCNCFAAPCECDANPPGPHPPFSTPAPRRPVQTVSVPTPAPADNSIFGLPPLVVLGGIALGIWLLSSADEKEGKK